MPRQELPEIDERRCTLCGDCLLSCPTDCLATIDHSRLVVAPQLCISCDVCAVVCAPRAITMVVRDW